MTEKKELKEVKRIKKEIKNGGGSPLLSKPFGSWPLVKWSEWEEDCNKNFNGCRWMKAYSDHLKARNSEENSEIWRKIAELEAKIDKLLEQPEPEPVKETIKSLGGEIEVN